MRAGSLTTLLRVYRPVTERDSFGSPTTEWEECRSIRAERVRVTARSIAENSEEWPDYSPSYRVNIAHLGRLEEGMRVADEREPQGRLYAIRTIVPDPATASITLTTDRVNL